jgi:hypothetical protein
MQKRRVALLAVLAYVLGVASPYVGYWGFNRFVHSVFGHDEVLRLSSPDGVLDAVVMRVNPGAFSSFLYNLYLVPKGTKRIEGVEDPILCTSEGDAPTIRWERSHFLNVDIVNSHVTFFANLWYSNKVNDYYVELNFSTESGKHYLQDNGRLRSE